MQVSDFDFDLPPERIAQVAVPRAAARLLVLDRATGARTHAAVRDLPRFLHAGDLLVVNDSRVFPARLLGHRVPSGALRQAQGASSTPRGGRAECLLLAREDEGRAAVAEGRPDGVGDEPADLRRESPAGSQVWSALVHPGQKLKPGARLCIRGDAGVLTIEILERQFHGRRRVRLWAEEGGSVDALVDALGHVPLPPYIHRPDTSEDRERYQTVYATHRGSIAAPTAGLHFDAALLDALAHAGVQRATVTLHVGYGTFKPVRAETVEEHVVDPEHYEISATDAVAINRALDDGRRIVAVGTTTTRALEDAAARAEGRVRPGRAIAERFIHPGVEVRVVSGLLTNFHLPKSSLLMLVSAVAGRERVLAAYRDAVEQGYRFYSYGDAMLAI